MWQVWCPLYRQSVLDVVARHHFLASRTAPTNNRSMRRVIVIALTCAFFVVSAKAVRELVVMERPELSQRVEGIVLDPSGAPIPDMIVTDRAENGVAVIRTTKTDSKGHFHFPSQRGKTAASSLRTGIPVKISAGYNAFASSLPLHVTGLDPKGLTRGPALLPFRVVL